jgi:hypothetical protein
MKIQGGAPNWKLYKRKSKKKIKKIGKPWFLFFIF